jgi:hypothetical protein
MRNQLMLLVVICALILITGAYPLQAHWIEDGLGVCNLASHSTGPVSAPDGMGGAFVAWADNRNGNADIYAQRLSVSGTPLWTANGVPVCTDPSYLDYIDICADGAGGAIVVWIDQRNGNNDVYAQRIGPNGTRRWTSNGVAICTDANNQNYPHLAPDGAGGAIVVWEDWRNGNDDVYAQRIDAAGYVWWQYNGVAVCNQTSTQNWIRVVSDNAGGAILCWLDMRNGNADIYAQRISGVGTALWTANGVAISAYSQGQYNPAVAADGAGGAIMTWMDQRFGNNDIYAQRINASGVTQWTADGMVISGASGSQFYPYLDTDGAGGAIVAFLDDRFGGSVYQVFVQRVNGAGVVQWTTNGVQLSSRPVYQWEVRVVSDGAGGAIVSWEDYGNIRARRVDAAGAPQWNADGILLCGASDAQSGPRIVSNDAGGAIVAWTDMRSGDGDVYAANIEPGGELYRPAPEIVSVDDVPADQGGEIYLSWDASRDESFHGDWVTHYTVWRAIDPLVASGMLAKGGTFLNSSDGISGDLPTGAVRIQLLGASIYYWQLVETQDLYYQDTYGMPLATLYDSTSAGTAYHYFQVVAQTADPMVYWASSPDSGYSVDDLAPCPPLALSGEQSQVPEGLQLTWAPNTEIDLDGYRVYRGTSEGFLPGSGNLIAAVCDTTLFDGGWRWSEGYWYKVASVDVHGNESAFAVLGPSQVTGDDSPRVPDAAFLSQNYPNPFNPSTVIAFGIEEPARVSLRIYDAAGRIVRVLLDERREAGRHEAIWDGRDEGGMPVGSGVYFYRFEAGAFSETNKMILLR